MLTIKIDQTQLQDLKRQYPAKFRRACESVLKSESFRLKGALATQAQQTMVPLAPMTPLLRKGAQQVGPFLSRFMQYDVDPATLSALIGILDKGKRPVSKGISVLAQRQAKGYAINITRASQRYIAKRIKAKLGRLTGRGQWGSYGGVLAFIPKYGRHFSRARPIVSVVYERERTIVIANIRRNLAIKLSGGRY